jgi:hypothetical protein
MPDLNFDHYRDEHEEQPDTPLTPPRHSSVGLQLTIAMLAVGGAIAIYLAFLRPASAPVAPAAAPKAAARPSTSTPLGGEADAIDVPPLDQTDGLVRRLVGAVSPAGIVNTWLSGDGLIRNFVVVAVNLAEGATPAKLIARLRPSGTFRVVDRNGRQMIDPRSYERYDAAADAIVEMDPARVARLYATLKPRIEEAYRDLGFTDRSFDRALQDIIVTLVRTPIPGDQPIVKRDGLRYKYVDQAFEELTAAQKQYLRMGARNVQRVDAWLRRLADALGIPPAAFSAS